MAALFDYALLDVLILRCYAMRDYRLRCRHAAAIRLQLLLDAFLAADATPPFTPRRRH